MTAALDEPPAGERVRRAAERVSPDALPAVARRVAFWCAYARADVARRSAAADDARATRGRVALVDACAAILRTARDVAGRFPGRARAARRAILASPALVSGFLASGAATAAATADLALEDATHGGVRDDPDPACSIDGYVEVAAALVETELRGEEYDAARDETTLDETTRDETLPGKRFVHSATARAAAVVPLTRLADAATRRRLAAAASRAAGSSPARRALAAETSAAMLSRLDFRASGSDEEPPSRVRVRGFADVAAANALVDAFAAALSLAATGNDDAAARAATAAATALRRAADPAVAANVAAGAVPDFAAVSAAGAAIERAVVSRAPAAVNLAAALVAAAPAHAARALALVAEETRRGMDDAARAALLPVVRAALERHVAEAMGRGRGRRRGRGRGRG